MDYSMEYSMEYFTVLTRLQQQQTALFLSPQTKDAGSLVNVLPGKQKIVPRN
jgi:hypothetical protein